MSDSDQSLTELEIRLSHIERTEEQIESGSQETGTADDRPPHL